MNGILSATNPQIHKGSNDKIFSYVLCFHSDCLGYQEIDQMTKSGNEVVGMRIMFTLKVVVISFLYFSTYFILMYQSKERLCFGSKPLHLYSFTKLYRRPVVKPSGRAK